MSLLIILKQFFPLKALSKDTIPRTLVSLRSSRKREHCYRQMFFNVSGVINVGMNQSGGADDI